MKKDGGEHFVVTSNVIAPDEYNYDWTSTTDAKMWQFLTQMRYEMVKEVVLSGRTAQFKGTGNSLSPHVKSGDICFIDPIRPGINSEILAGDIVFAAVQPNDRHYIHLVWRIEQWKNEYGVKRTVYVIGNNYNDHRKKCNGWAYREHVFGILTKTERGVVTPERKEIYDSDSG